ncbi:hypothetical protein [Azospirillum largimobile]
MKYNKIFGRVIAIVLIAWVLQPLFVRNYESVMERYGWHSIFLNWIENEGETFNLALSYVWVIAFTTLLIVFFLFLNFILYSRFQSSNSGKTIPTSIADIKNNKVIALGHQSRKVVPDLEIGRHFTVTLTGHSILYAPIHPPSSGSRVQITLEVFHGGKYTLSYQSCYKFRNDTALNLSPNDPAIFHIHTNNGGESWYAEKIR